VGVHAVSEKPYELADEASIRAIEAQATLVESLRSRAGTMLAATALVTSFFGGQALAPGGKPLHFLSYTSGALVSFIAVAGLTLAMLLPFTLRLSLSAVEILKVVEGELQDDPFPSAEALREVALQYESMYDSTPGKSGSSRLVSGWLSCSSSQRSHSGSPLSPEERYEEG